jgi:hypothetical protein
MHRVFATKKPFKIKAVFLDRIEIAPIPNVE